jgi:hypothetical protein
MLNDMASWFYGHAIGGTVSDGGSTQGSGAGVAPNIDFDTTAIVEAVAAGTFVGEVAAGTDIDADAGDQIAWGATSGKSVVGAVVLLDSGAFEIAFGTVADTGAEAAPTDAEVQAWLDAEAITDGWVRICDATVNRTADTTLTQSFDHSVKGVLKWPGSLAETEAEFRAELGAGTTPTP